MPNLPPAVEVLRERVDVALALDSGARDVVSHPGRRHDPILGFSVYDSIQGKTVVNSSQITMAAITVRMTIRTPRATPPSLRRFFSARLATRLAT